MTDYSRRKLLLSLAAALPAAYAAPAILVGKAHAGSPSVTAAGPGDETCEARTGFMRHYYPSDIAAIDASFKVRVLEVCAGDEIMRSDGNGEGLRKAIAANPVLVSALEAKGFGPNDVFAVRIAKVWKTKKIRLEVHRFNQY